MEGATAPVHRSEAAAEVRGWGESTAMRSGRSRPGEMGEMVNEVMCYSGVNGWIWGYWEADGVVVCPLVRSHHQTHCCTVSLRHCILDGCHCWAADGRRQPPHPRCSSSQAHSLD